MLTIVSNVMSSQVSKLMCLSPFSRLFFLPLSFNHFHSQVEAYIWILKTAQSIGKSLQVSKDRKKRFCGSHGFFGFQAMRRALGMRPSATSTRTAVVPVATWAYQLYQGECSGITGVELVDPWIELARQYFHTSAFDQRSQSNLCVLQFPSFLGSFLPMRLQSENVLHEPFDVRDIELAKLHFRLCHYGFWRPFAWTAPSTAACALFLWNSCHEFGYGAVNEVVEDLEKQGLGLKHQAS